MASATRPEIETIETIEADQGTEIREKIAPLYRVICHDDPYTTMDFVVDVLRSVFRLPLQTAIDRMYRVHHAGSALIGRYPRKVAEGKVERAVALARAQAYPLVFSIEPDD